MADNDTRPYGTLRATNSTVPPEQRAAWQTRGKRSVEFGAAWLIGGLLVTVVTHGQVHGTGAHFVTWAPVLYGIHRIVAGLQLLARCRDLP
ncbi:hypothetical protein [Streptomyces sp. HD]|uniref:hypothetical protein n=1 Tax=Streptomyces sp. HD TaxID=3020892 RepID=UPI00232F3110|nr:hypothetical protein [Streptomyces sp. HD]MDC0768937.1 hypothetical protein [Streptomyces sp. HD]